MGWDYHIYMDQPNWFIKLVSDLILKNRNDSSKITDFNRRPR